MNGNDSVTIRCIDKTVVNQICSGQVILSLATAVKELIENSIDANATSIQIRLKEYGTEVIEVSDNGHGVEESNFQALTLKHYTSKISDFSDISSVETFGFRGEALSSLCTLSKVCIITRHKDAISGTKLNFDQSGIIINSSKTARQIGTTVILENIFSTLPVRHKEFVRNIKKEFTKMCNVLYAYGLLSKGVSIICTNQLSNRKVTVMETMGDTLKSNITQIFGAKQAQNLLEVTECFPHNKDNEDHLNKGNCESESEVKLEGYISSCDHGCGRSSCDRQFYYINSRPVDNTKVIKLVNDVYHQYNPHQYPFIVLNMKILMKCIDVNVTPDKRMIFMKNEKLLLSIIESSLHTMFKNIPAIVKFQNIGIVTGPALQSSKCDSDDNCRSLADKLKRFRTDSSVSRDKEVKVEKKSAENRELFKSRNMTSIGNIPVINKFFSRIETSVSSREDKSADRSTHRKEINEKVEPESKKVAHLRDNECPQPKLNAKATEIEGNYTSNTDNIDADEMCEFLNGVKGRENSPAGSKRKAVPETADNFQRDEKVFIHEIENDSVKRPKTDEGLTETFKKKRKTLMLDLHINVIKNRLSGIKKNRSENLNYGNEKIRFYCAINPQHNESAEKELKRELHNDSFKHMNIIGQFNLGFIITSLGPDIFIIDQHATDEKYNFEDLQLNTKLQTQKLVVPQNLNLTVEKEELFLHYSDIIRKNGFDFIFNDKETPTNRIKLTSIPLSRNWIFGKEDIEELLFMLENASDQKMCRPSRIRDMFASRACRKSVMIGTALSHSEMKRIIEHMGEMEQPWNCPHGRPTIRHLINLNMLQKSDKSS